MGWTSWMIFFASIVALASLLLPRPVSSPSSAASSPASPVDGVHGEKRAATLVPCPTHQQKAEGGAPSGGAGGGAVSSAKEEDAGEEEVYGGHLRIARRPGLSAPQREVEAGLVEIVQNATLADALYDALPFTNGGRMLSMDHARFLSPHYHTEEERLKFTPATRNAAAAYVKDRLQRALKKPGTGRLLLTSGGPGSGKTSLITSLVDGAWQGAFTNVTLVLDCTLSNYAAGSNTISVFLKAGWRVDVVHVYRPYGAAVMGVLDRAMKTGRYVGMGPNRSMSLISVAAQDVFTQLHHTYKDSQGAYFWVFTAPRYKLKRIPTEWIAPGGPYHHGSFEELHAQEMRVIDKFLAQGGSKRIVDAALHGTTGGKGKHLPE